MKRLKEICIITLVILIIGVTYSFATTGTANTNGIRIRREPSTDAEILTNIHNGDKVEIIEKSGDWYKVTFEEYSGYVHSDYIKADGKVVDSTPVEEKTPEETPENTPTENKPAEVKYPANVKTTSNVKVYVVPSVTSSSIMDIAKDKTITVNSKVANWSHISYGNRTGWVRNYVLENVVTSENPAEEKPETPDTTGNETSFTKGYVNVEEGIMREEPKTSGEVIQGLKLNTEVKIISEENDWYKIEYDGETGYMAVRLISEKKTGTTSRGTDEQREVTTSIEDTDKVIKTGYVNVGIANIREGATTSSGIITTLRQKAKVEITGEKLNFYKININEDTGYISKDLVSDSLKDIEALEDKVVSSTSSGSGSKAGQKIVSYAKKYLGESYAYGGTTPSGFDCSGFVYYVFDKCGYDISRSCSVQARSGKSVSKAKLEPGDLVFFDNGSNRKYRTCWYIHRRRKIYTCS